VGQKPNSQLLHFLPPSTFASSGHIRVKASLQVAHDAIQNIYAAGDVIAAGTIKNGRSAMQQGYIVAQNVVRSIKGQRQIGYRQKWWEGATKLSLGLVRTSMFRYSYNC
jgi:NADH dehydrogenase FAD-containing subunit